MNELTYPALAANALRWRWDHTAFIDDDASVTLGVQAQRAWALAAALRDDYGVERGDVFAVVAANGTQYASLWQTAGWGGGVLTPVNARLAEPELAYVLTHCRPKVIFVDSDHAERVHAIRSQLRDLCAVVLIDDGDGPHDRALPDLLPSGRVSAAVPPTRIDPTDPVMLMYTGGTTGRPKAVLHDQQAICLALHRTQLLWAVSDPDTCLYQCTPMFHIMGINAGLAVPAGGGRVVIRRTFDVGTTIADIERHSVTHIAMVPTQLVQLLDHPQFSPRRLASLRFIAYGGAPVPGPVLARYLELLPRVDFVQSYGMTEVLGTLTALSPAQHRAGGPALASVGRPQLGVHIDIQDPEGHSLPNGGVGEICVRTGSVMTGYRDDPVRTAQALRGGWYHTGDVGRVDAGGNLYVCDRLDDMIISGGENIHTTEVEAALAGHPAVAQVAVVGVPDERWGQAVHAVVVRTEDPLSAEELLGYARTQLAGYKLPKSITFHDGPLPMSVVGKVQKHQLRDLVVGASGPAAEPMASRQGVTN